MAIKGKRKGKARSGRVVTAGPRPTYVQPKVPLFQRTAAKFLVALVFEAVIFALIVGFGEQSQGDRQRAGIEEFTSLVQASLSSAGSSIQALPVGSAILPELGTTLSGLQGEDPPKPEDVAAQTEAGSTAVARAADAIAALRVPEESLDPEQRVMLTDARNLMERGLRVYVGIAREVGVAAQIEGEPQQELITALQEQMTVAGGIFDAGYGRLQEARRLAGLPTGSAVPSGGIPGVAPGGQPGFPLPVPEPPVQQVPAGGGGKSESGGGGGDGKGGGNG